MFPNATVSSRSSSSKSDGHTCSRNSSMPSLRMRSPLSPKTSFNPLFRYSDAFTSFDASNFICQEQKKNRKNKNPILRRYNSHDSQTNFSTEGRDNTTESTKSRSSEGTADSTGDKKLHEFEARDFLERYSLPRVVRVADGEPLLLYRCFDSFTKVQARGIFGRKGKEKEDGNVLYFPEGYSGWFSLVNEKGEKSAVSYTSILQLVREQVCSFISLHPFTAYTSQNNEPSETPGKVQYLKTTVRGGQLFQLRAVFQHRDRPEGGRHSTKSSKVSRSARDKDLANRYAQLISQSNQELYVPLTTKGEFYEIHTSIKAKLCFPGLLDKTGPLALDKDCLYKITHLLRRVALPLKVKLLAGPLPLGLPKEFTDTFYLERKFQEPLMVTCTLPSPSENTKHEISCVSLNSGVKISKCMLGFDSESRLFKSQRLQAALAFCHKNVEAWYREVRLAPNLEIISKKTKPEIVTNPEEPCPECKNKKCDMCKAKEERKQLITKEAMEKFPKSKKWYHKILGGGSGVEKDQKGENVEKSEKVKSMERYKDMSKLIEEKFGKKEYNPVKKSASFMFSTKRMDLEETSMKKGNPALLKCQSLDNQLCSSGENKGKRMEFKLKKFERSLDDKWGKGELKLSKEDSKTKSYWYKNKNDGKIKSKNETKSEASKLELLSNRSSASNSLNSDFRMCLLDNETSPLENKTKFDFLKKERRSLIDFNEVTLKVTEIDFDEIKPLEELKPMKMKPDLIPTLTKDSSFITDRLCSEFHVKTKVQKRNVSKANTDKSRSSLKMDTKKTIFEIDMQNHQQVEKNIESNVKSITVQVHENKKIFKNCTVDIDDIPYSNVADEVCSKPGGKKNPEENIYAEICEERCCNCDMKKLCDCKRTNNNKRNGSEYCYVKLGSNGESVTSDSDEAIYNTLR